MPVVVVVGAQWGDEGKGKVVDLYSRYADVVVRYGGGANAGHTLVVGGEKVVFHLVPSGVLHERTRCIVGPGTVVDPRVLVDELSQLADRGLLKDPRVLISDRAHVVLPHHIELDGLADAKRKIGTTKRGIGPAYQDKVARRGVRVGDLLDSKRFEAKLADNRAAWEPVAAHHGGELQSVEQTLAEYLPLAEKLREYIRDTTEVLATALEDGKRILLEGAQGTMLDVDHGTYPFVTSSTVIAGGASAGAGIGPTKIDRAVGITKAYTTRVGSGPFPTELETEAGDALREAGAEYGATTGRPRRCGWLDLIALRHAVRVNGLSELALTKLDVLGGMDSVSLCVGYELDGERIDRVPFDGLPRVQPIYEQMDGWPKLEPTLDSVEALPATARRYLDRITELARCPVGLVSVGADREQTLGVTDPFEN